MKRFMIITAIAGFGMFPLIARAEERDSTGMPGDNFDLQGAMELFRTSKNLESFEKALNLQKNAVNNLDLNGDGKVDYVSVFDKADGDNHAIIMRIAINEKENQDIAVIAIQKQGNQSAQLQIIGDKEVYGEETIMEPYDEAVQKSSGPSASLSALQPAIVFVNVWGWPCVSYMYGPYYSYYNSPWYWGYYPNYWDPWAPYYWYDYYPRVYHYHNMYYHHAAACYVPRAQNVYYQHRSYSPTVNNRYASARQNFDASRNANGGRGSVQTIGARPANARPAPQTAAPSRRENIQSTPVSPESRPATPSRTQPSTISPSATPNTPSRQQPREAAPSRQERPRQMEPVNRPQQPSRQQPSVSPQPRPMPSARPMPAHSRPSGPSRAMPAGRGR